MMTKRKAPRIKKPARGQSSTLMVEAVLARGEAADATTYAAQQAEALARTEAQGPFLATLKRLDELRARLAGVDMTFWPLRSRVLRSGLHIGHMRDELLASNGESFNAVRLEIVNALWWEIRAIQFFRDHPRGRRPGAIGPNQKALRELLHEDPNASTHDALVRLNEKQPGHNLKRGSLTVELSKARKALGITKN